MGSCLHTESFGVVFFALWDKMLWKKSILKVVLYDSDGFAQRTGSDIRGKLPFQDLLVTEVWSTAWCSGPCMSRKIRKRGTSAVASSPFISKEKCVFLVPSVPPLTTDLRFHLLPALS